MHILWTCVAMTSSDSVAQKSTGRRLAEAYSAPSLTAEPPNTLSGVR